MSNLILSNALTMSSLEIADLVQSRHTDVKRSIERLAKRGTITLPSMAFSEKINNLGFQVNQKYYLFTGEQGKRDSIIAIAQLCPEFTARLVDRWQELENQVNKPTDPMKALEDPEIMRGLLLSYSEKVINLQNENKELKPKAEALDRIATADGLICITNAAKDLGVRPKDLFHKLHSMKWIYRRNGSGSWTAYQDKIQQGLLDHKLHTVHLDDGVERITERVVVTPKGITKLSLMLVSNI